MHPDLATRTTMQVVHEGNNTYITNLKEVADSVGLAPADLLTFIACMCECENDGVDGLYDLHAETTLNAVLDEYSDTFIKCPHCSSMNTTLQVSRTRPLYRISCDDCSKKKVHTMWSQYARFLAWVRCNYSEVSEGNKDSE